MAFDSNTRNKLVQLVNDCRKLLEEEFGEQLEGRFGIRADGQIAEIDTLTSLTDAELAIATILRQRIEHLSSTDASGGKPEVAIRRVLREQAFTLLNRFVAIRMAESRELIRESLAQGDQSKGFAVYDQITGSVLGERYERYRCFLYSLFDELSIELGALFDRYSPQGMLFPGEVALSKLLDHLNRSDLREVWAADETIGWIYQYWNTREEISEMRKQSSAPRNSRELAVRNQFFTPRYVVEFLTDNTLGRTWYEMTQGNTTLSEKCRYLVCKPNENFLGEGEAAPPTPSEEGLSKEEILRLPVHVPFRPVKDPREILMLDPACGSMHFGLYAFDVFQTIYEEAWDLGIESLRADYPEKSTLLRDVPKLIIENNIHGVDIDHRATQIAGLALWLRAQRAWLEQGLKALERPQIVKSNVVCAEPMPGDPEQLQAFATKLHPALSQMVERIFEKMQLAGEAGALLKIDEIISGLVDRARQAWKSQRSEMFSDRDLGLSEQGEIDLSSVSSTRFFNEAEERIYKALEKYAEGSDSDSSGEYRRKLFAEDAAQGFSFINLCRKRYDVIVMNPPFGEWSKLYKAESKKVYPNSYNDILAAFVDRGGEILVPGGQLGAITSRTCFFLSSFTKWREEIVLNMLQPRLLVDLGHGVMDAAMVEAAAYVLEKPLEGIAQA